MVEIIKAENNVSTINTENNIENGKDAYNPFEHRNVRYPTSNIRATANMIKSCVGSGLLAMPSAMKNAGYGLGLVSTIVLGVICTHCIQIFVRTSQEACKLERVPLLGYAETCGAAIANGPKKIRFLAKSFRVFADGAMFFTYLGMCCVYVVLMAESIKQMVDQFHPELVLDTKMYCLILLVPLAILSQVKNLTFLAPLSMLANIMLVTVCGICLYYIFGDTITFEGKEIVNDIHHFPMFLATVLFAMEGIGVVMPTENNMAKPKNFLGCPGVLIISMIFVVVLYAFLGFLGYIRFGSEVAGSITLNLPMDEWPALSAKVLLIGAIFFTYALQFYVPVDILWKYTEPRISKNHHTIGNIIVRIISVCITVAFAVAIPLLEQVIGIVGALFLSLLGITIPAIIETVFYWEKCSWFLILKNLILLAISLFAMIAGCTVTIQEIIRINAESSLE